MVGKDIEKLRKKISELEDLEEVTQLDVINIKEEVDRLKSKMVPIPKEVEDKIAEMERAVSKIKKIEKWEDSISEIEKIRKRLNEIKTIRMEEREIEKDVERLKKSISSIRSEVRRLRRAGIEEELKDVSKNVEKMEALKKGMEKEVVDAIKDRLVSLEREREEIKRIRREVEKLKGMKFEMPPDIKNRISELEEEIGYIRGVEDKLNSIDEIKERVSRLEAKIVGKNEIEQIKKRILEIGEMKKGEKKMSEEIKKISEEISSIEKKIDTIKKMRAEFSGRERKEVYDNINMIKGKLEALEREMKEFIVLKRKVESLKKLKKYTSPELKKRISDMERKIEGMIGVEEEVIENMRERLSKVEDEIARIRMREEQGEVEMGKEKESISEIMKRLEEHEKVINAMKQRVEKTYDERGIADLRSVVEKLIEMVEKNSEGVERIGELLKTGQPANFQKMMAHVNERIDVLENVIEGMKKRIEEMKEIKMVKLPDVEKAGKIEGVKREVEDLKLKIGDMEKKISSMEESVSKGVLMGKEREIEIELAYLKKMLNSIRAEQTALHEKMESMETDKIMEKLKELEMKVSSIHSSIPVVVE